jgi:translation initiation factor 4E
MAVAASPAGGGVEFFSFNEAISPGSTSWQAPSASELDEMRQKDPALRCEWSIWEQIMQQSDSKASQYSDATHKIATFGTVKNFWRYWNYLPQPSLLLDGKKFVREQADGRSVVNAIMIFREGIKPEWEDASNARGGHFQFQLRPALGGGKIDEYWNNIVLGMIGSTIEPADMITGVRLVDKLSQTRSASIRIEVWFTNYDDTEKVDQLQRSLERCMTTRLDGSLSASSAWGKTDRKKHTKK